MSQNVKGTFASGASTNAGAVSDALVIPSNVTSIKLTLGGTLDASNSVKTQKSTNNGQAWADQSTYTSAQSATPITVAAGEQWRLALAGQQAYKTIDYSLSAES